MKRFLIALSAVALLSGCTCSVNLGQGFGGGKRVVCNGEVQDRMLDSLSGFDKIVVSGQADLKYVQTADEYVRVKANAEVFDYLDFKVEDGTLVLKTKDKVQIKAKEFEIIVGSPLLKSLKVSGAADVDITGVHSAEDLTISISGAGDCEMKDIQVPCLTYSVSGAGDLDAQRLDVEKLYVSISGAGDVDLSGKAGYASLSVSGAGDIDARELDCPQIEKHKSGAASIKTK